MTEAAGWLRRAGHGVGPDGTGVTWSVAEGRRGRRWREVRVRDGAVISSLLLELEPDGRFSHMELSTAAGLLTLHPETDGTLHGNSIVADGVRHVAGLAWSPEGVVLLDGSAIARAAAVARIAGSLGPGASAEIEALIIGLDLALDRRRCRVARTAEGSWVFEGQDPLEVAEDGMPRLPMAADWPLEE